MYRYCETDSSLISLHDCFASKMTFADGKLTLHFPEGFWLTPLHPENHSDSIVRTGEAQVVFQLESQDIYDIHVQTTTRNKGSYHITKDWEPQAFLDAVNSGRFKLEFIWPYQGYHSILYKCWLRNPQYRPCGDCALTVDNLGISYHWNEIDYERVW